jgi:hypothetical protein
MAIIFIVYSFTIIIASSMAVLAQRKRCFFSCYLLGLPPLFTVWLIVELQVLEQCINCFEKGINSLAPEICCSLTNIELIPYTQIALIANALYFLAFIGVTVIVQKRSYLTDASKVIPAAQIASSLVRAIFFHAFIITCAGMVILILATSINIRPFRSWETLGYAFLGVLPAITTFFVLSSLPYI